MKLYKLTHENGQTYNHTQWGERVMHVAPGTGGLCTDGWLHAYTHPLLAVFLNPIHANLDPETMRLWEAEGEVGKTDHGLKVGCTSLTTLREIPKPEVTVEQRVRFGILCALAVPGRRGGRVAFKRWTESWLDGTDRSEAAARAAAWAAWAARAAAGAAWAAEAAAGAAAIDLIALAEEAVRG